MLVNAAGDLRPVHDRAKTRMPWYAKSDDYPTDTTATKNMVTSTASTSMNMVVTPSSALDLSVRFEFVASLNVVIFAPIH
jgi:hypothetical protein